jgi:hypothetical protein
VTPNRSYEVDNQSEAMAEDMNNHEMTDNCNNNSNNKNNNNNNNNNNTDLYVVDDVTGVNPYKRYVDKWNPEVPGYSGGGDDSIDRHDTDIIDDRETDREVAAAATTEAAGEFDIEVPRVDTVITPAQPNTPGGVPQDGGRPTMISKPVQRLVPSFKGKSYGTTMAQCSKLVLGMLAMEMVQYMESQLMQVGDNRDADTMGIIMAHFLMKESTKWFGKTRTKDACRKEIKQIHMKNTFVPKHWYELSKKQKAQMLEAFIFLTKKRSGEIKARKVLGGNTQRSYISKDVASSPTASTVAVMITAVIDSKEKRHVAMVDIPNAFVQTVIKDKDVEHQIIVRLRGQIVDILCEIALDV